MTGRILTELRRHAPFTAAGAATGVVMMVLLRGLPQPASYKAFYVLHPLHVFLSALVTAAMYRRHTRQRSILPLLLIGYAGSVGIATISDSVIPFLGEALLGLPEREIHLGFIEEWWLVNPLALSGIAVAYFWPRTRFPHTGHVLLSTWASLFHIIMALGSSFPWHLYLATFVFLFFAVWLPCCLSDIVFPLLFVRQEPG